MPRNKLFDVFTWDAEAQQWTPQKGVRKGPYNRWGVRRALRTLQDMGYGVGIRDNYSVLVEEHVPGSRTA